MDSSSHTIFNRNSRILIYTLDSQARLTFFNSDFKRIFDKILSEPLSIGGEWFPLLQAIPQKVTIKNHIDKALNGKSFSVRESFSKNEVFESCYAPILKNGNPEGAIITMHYVPDTKETEDPEKLHDGDSLLSSINKNIKEGIYRSTLDKGIIYVNDAMMRMFGFEDLEEILSYDFEKLYKIPTQRNQLSEMLLDYGSIKNVEVEYYKKDGTTFWGSLTATTVASDNGDIFFDGAIRDITLQKTQRDRLEIFETLFDQSSDLLAISTLDGTLLQTNPQWNQALDFNIESGSLINLVAHAHPEDKTVTHNFIEKLIQQSIDTIRVETRLKNNVGSYTWLEIQSKIDNVSQKIYTVARDISERRQQQEALVKSEEQFKAFTDNIPGMVFIKYPNGKHTFANRETLRFFNISLKTYQNSTVEDLTTGHITKQANESDRWVFKYKKSLKSQYYIPASGQWYEEYKFPIGNQLVGGFLLDISERKKTEKDLIRESTLQQLLFEISSEIVNISLDNVQSKINKALAKIGRFVDADRVYIFEYKHKEAICKNTFEWCGQGISPQIQNLQKVPIDFIPFWLDQHKKNKEVIIEDTGKLPDSSLKNLLHSQDIKSLITVPLYHEGESKGFIGFDSVKHQRTYTEKEQALLRVFAQMLVNVELRSETQQSLKDSEQKYKFLAEKTSDTVILSKPDRGFNYVSPNIYELTGFTVEEFINRPDQDYIYPEDRHVIEDVYARIHSGENHFVSEYRIYTKERRVIWLQTRTRVIRDEQGRPVNLLTTANNITDQKLTEQALIESESRYRSLSESVPVGIVVHRAQKLQYANPYALSMMEVENPEEVLKKDVTQFLYPDETRSLNSRIEKLMQTYNEPTEEVIRNINGKPIQVLVSGIKLNFEGKTAICNVFSNISDLKNTQANLQHALEEKEILFRELHHRIKNNLQLISSLLFIKSTNQKNAELKKFIDETSTKILSIAQIHDQLLTLEEVNKLNIKGYIEELVKNLIQTYQSESKKFDVNIEIEEIVIDTDVVLVIGLFVNEILSNSIKHAYPGIQRGKIDIKLSKADGRITLILRDYGVGIPGAYIRGRTDSYGIQLVNIFSKQLRGALKITNVKGTKTELSFPFKN